MESQNEEWKESWKAEHLNTISAFANCEGGIMVIGKRDNGDIVGIQNPGKLLESIPNTVINKLGFIPDVEMIDIDGKVCIEITVKKQLKLRDLDGRYYVRSGSTTQIVKGTELSKLLLTDMGLTWTDRTTEKVKCNDLSKDAMDFLIKMGHEHGRLTESATSDDAPALLDHFELRDGELLTLGAALLFHDNPDRHVPGSYIKIGVFSEKEFVIREKYVYGPLIKLPLDALEIIFDLYLQSTFEYENEILRVNRYEYPKAAIREALLNSVIHKDYSGGCPTEVRIYLDRVEIHNQGSLPRGWTVEKLLNEKHNSSPPNPKMAIAFHSAGLIEKWGEGVQKIKTACKENGNPMPTYEVSYGWVKLTFPKREKIEERIEPVTLPELSPSQSSVYELVKDDNFITAEEIAKATGISISTVKRTIAVLSGKGLIEREGNNRSGRWRIYKN